MSSIWFHATGNLISCVQGCIWTPKHTFTSAEKSSAITPLTCPGRSGPRETIRRAKELVLADDLYVPDDRANTFMWLDMSQRQNFENDISENLFNPKAAQ
jgi:hypothetical protein